MIVWFAAISCLLAILPAMVFIRNLALYAPLPSESHPSTNDKFSSGCSVLIPARNEEANIQSAVQSVLQNQGVDFEVIVLDDESSDRTREIVSNIAQTDKRVRLEIAPPLPIGWCGKQHACYVLSQRARYSVLLFIDADVRLEPDALSRMLAFMSQRDVALASGVPRQFTQTFSERLLIPLVHFVLLGFLPIKRMRESSSPAYCAGCGQLFVAQREAYHKSGGHRMIPNTLHDGWKLPRVFREASLMTDVFDATDIASCRMFLSNREVWRGLARNAHEGLGSPKLIGLTTLLLGGGQVVPICLLCAICLGASTSPLALVCTILGTAAGFLPRLVAVVRFHQPLSSAILHPIGISALLAIQWYALLCRLCKRSTLWRGRSY